MIMMRPFIALLSLLAIGLRFVSAAPHLMPQVLYIEDNAHNSPTVIQHFPIPARLPGFNHMMRNNTPPFFVLKYAGVFGGRCKDVRLGGDGKVGSSTLEARCIDNVGQWWDTSLNLNDCIANDDGKLVYHAKWVLLAFDALVYEC